MTSTYISGHHESVLRGHAWRTVQNSAAYLIPYLTSPSLSLLDVGCGPGTMTIDFARYLPQGHVYGIDPSAEAIERARAEAKKQGIHNVTFEVGDLFDLSASGIPTSLGFDIVHAHQVLQHIPDYMGAIKAMSDVVKPGGYLAIRCTDFETFVWWPLFPEMDRWKALFQQVSMSDGADQYLARRLLSLCLKSGFSRDQIGTTTGSWCYSGPEECEWWGGQWSERVLKSEFPKKAIEKGFSTQEELQGISEAFRKWSTCEDAWFGMLHSEVVCKVSGLT